MVMELFFGMIIRITVGHVEAEPSGCMKDMQNQKIILKTNAGDEAINESIGEKVEAKCPSCDEGTALEVVE